ncbi:MAG: AAA family ATPase [Planctomycetota bacterium]
MTTTLLDPDRIARGRDLLERARRALNATLLGQEKMIDLVLVALCARGHVLLEGLPGLGKTELVKALGRLLALTFRRVQFTPDLLPSDVTGGLVLEEQDGRRTFSFRPGPIFANLVLADEVNRASPKTQSAMLEAMQERRVTVFGETHALPSPFFVLATQNPIELEGTYPLPEAQLDRFLFKVEVRNVGADVLATILRERRRGEPPASEAAMSAAELDELFAVVDAVYLPDAVADYIGRLVAASQPDSPLCPERARAAIRFGASPRAAIALAEAGRAVALLAGRPNVDFADVDAVAEPALAHRLVLHHAARLEGLAPPAVVRELLEATPKVGKPLPRELRG